MQEALTGLSHVPSLDSLNTTFLSQDYASGTHSRNREGWGASSCLGQAQGSTGSQILMTFSHSVDLLHIFSVFIETIFIFTILLMWKLQ